MEQATARKRSKLLRPLLMKPRQSGAYPIIRISISTSNANVNASSRFSSPRQFSFGDFYGSNALKRSNTDADEVDVLQAWAIRPAKTSSTQKSSVLSYKVKIALMRRRCVSAAH